MKLSISNIAWDNSKDEDMYQYLLDNGIHGLEIAPTRLVSDNPYDNIGRALEIVKAIKDKYQLDVSSMQSIWFGRKESIFGTKEERNSLVAYTEKALIFAEAIGCKNLVFGSPRNRNMDDKSKYSVAVQFFGKLGELAQNHGVVIALEPNPVIYNTNFINKTKDALQFVKEINSKGLQVNMDLGTVIYNNEELTEIFDDIELIHHIHISEPNLALIEIRDLHKQLRDILQEKEYNRYVSIEMKNTNNIDAVKKITNYVNEVMK